MKRLPAVLVFLLLFLSFFAGTASAFMGGTLEKRVGDFFSPTSDCVGFDSPGAHSQCRENWCHVYDVASDVRKGVNKYAYVQQNPFTKFDPLGLRGVPWHQKALGWSSVESNSLGFRVNDQGQPQARTRQYDHNFFTGGVRNDSGYQWRSAEGTSWETYFEKNPDTGNYKVASQEKARSQFFNAVAQEVGSHSRSVENTAKASIFVSSFAVPAASVGSKGLSWLGDGVNFLSKMAPKAKSSAPALSSFEGASVANSVFMSNTSLSVQLGMQNIAAKTIASATFLEGFESSASFFSGLSGSNPAEPSLMDMTSFSPHNVFDPGNSFSAAAGSLGYGLHLMTQDKPEQPEEEPEQ